MATQAYEPRYTSGHQAPPGHVTAVVHKQYNSPMPLYSMDNVVDTLASQAQVLTNGAVGVDFHALGSPVLQRSQVYRMLQEEEGRPERATPSPTPGPDSPPATFQSQSFIRIQKSLGDTEDEPALPTIGGKLQDIRKPSPLAVEWPPPQQQYQQQQQQYQSTQQYHPSIAAHRQQPYRPGVGNQSPQIQPQYQQQYQRPPQLVTQQQYRSQAAAPPLQSGGYQPVTQQQYRPIVDTGYRPQVVAQPLHSPTTVQPSQVSVQPLHTVATARAPPQQQYRPQVTAQPLSPQPPQPPQQSSVPVNPAYHPTVVAHQSLTKAAQGSSNDPGVRVQRQQAPASSSTATGYRGSAPNGNDMGESSPSMRRRPVWPPQNQREYLQTSTQSMHFTASKASKKFVWPPPKEFTSYEYEEYQQQSPKLSRREAQQRADGFLPGPARVVRIQPRSPARLAAEAWQPYSGGQNEHHVRFAPGSAPSRRIKRFEDVIHQSNATRLPPTYRPPPGTQHVVFESEEEED